MKRFHDTELWFRAWFMEMTPDEKLAFLFIKDRCDCVGVWPVNMPLLKMMTGYEGTIANLLTKSNGNLKLMEGTWEADSTKAKLWIPDFCYFQYGNLSDKSPPHRKYIKALQDHNLFERVTQRVTERVTQGVCVTPQEEEEEEEEEKETEGSMRGDGKKKDEETHAQAITDQLRIVINNATGGTIHPGKLKVEYDILRNWAKGQGIPAALLVDVLTFASTSPSKGTHRPLTNAKVFTFEYGNIRKAMEQRKSLNIPSDEEIQRRYKRRVQ